MRDIGTAPTVTRMLIAINVIVFLAETATGTPLGGVGNGRAGTIYSDGALLGPYIAGPSIHGLASHQYYRLLTAGFLHDGLLHILFNMFFLFIMGPMLEPAIGRVNFAVVYFVSLLAGSLGAMASRRWIPSSGRPAHASGCSAR